MKIFPTSSAMATPTDTETKEIMSAIATLTACITRLESTAAANHAALTQRMEVGFAQMDTKLAEVKGDIKALDQKVTGIDDRLKSQETKLSSIDTKLTDLKIDVSAQLAKTEGDINLLRQPKDFWDFIKKGMAVTVFSGLLLTFGKFILTGKVM